MSAPTSVIMGYPGAGRAMTEPLVVVSEPTHLVVKILATAPGGMPVDVVNPHLPIAEQVSVSGESLADVFSARDSQTYAVVVRPPASGSHRFRLSTWRDRVAAGAKVARATDLVVGTSAALARCRLIVIADVRESTLGRRRLTAWVRDVGRGLRYETEVNGTPVDDLSYVVIDDSRSDADAARLLWRRHLD